MRLPPAREPWYRATISCITLALMGRRGGKAPSPGAARHPLPKGEGLIAGQENQRAARQRDATSQSFRGWSRHSCLLTYKYRGIILGFYQIQAVRYGCDFTRADESAYLTTLRLAIWPSHVSIPSSGQERTRAPSPDAARHPLPRGEGMIVGQGDQCVLAA